MLTIFLIFFTVIPTGYTNDFDPKVPDMPLVLLYLHRLRKKHVFFSISSGGSEPGSGIQEF
jgi:hypothetical protein